MTRHFISYPKSGRTWVRFVLTELGVTDAILFHHDRFEFNDGSLPAHDFDLTQRLEAYPDGARVVYMERDPRDVMVSLYHQVTGRFRDFFGYTGSLSDFLRDDYFGAHNLKQFRAMWAVLSNERNFLKITYEDCHHDLAYTISNVVRYYEFEVPEGAIEAAVAKGTFSNMKKIEKEGRFAKPWLQPRNDAPKVRQGVVGGYRSALNAEDIIFLNAMFDLPNQGTEVL